MMENKMKHGGARANSGRKKIEDKKVTVAIYPQKSRINILGAEAVKSIAIEAIEKEYKRNVKESRKNLENNVADSK